MDKLILSDVADVTKLAGFEYSKYMKYIDDGEIIAVRALNLKDGELVLDDVKRISKDVSDSLERSQLKKYDIVISYTGTIGECAQIVEDGKYHLAPNVAKITPKDNVDPDYLFQYIRSDMFKNTMKSYCHGSTQPTIPMKVLRELPVYILPMDNQKKIATILHSLDDKIKNNKSINQNLEQQAKARFKSWFVDFEPFGGMKPNDWVYGTIADLAQNIICGKTPSTKNDEYYGDDIPFITIPDMHNSIYIIKTERYLSSLGAASQSNKTLEKNSVCVSCIGTAGLVSLVSEESQTNQQINSIVPKKGCSPFYIYLLMQTLPEIINKLGQSGSTIVNLNKAQFSRITVLIPPKTVMKSFDDLMSPLFESILNNQKQNEKLSILRDTLLPKLMSGELDVSTLDL